MVPLCSSFTNKPTIFHGKTFLLYAKGWMAHNNSFWDSEYHYEAHKDVLSIWDQETFLNLHFPVKVMKYFLYERENCFTVYNVGNKWRLWSEHTTIFTLNILTDRPEHNILTDRSEQTFKLGSVVQNLTKLLANVPLKFLSWNVANTLTFFAGKKKSYSAAKKSMYLKIP